MADSELIYPGTLVCGNGLDSYGMAIRGIEELGLQPVIVTDPPFNIGYHYEGFRDKKPSGQYFEELAAMVRACPTVLVHYPEALHQVSISTGMAPEKVVSWVYNSNTAKQHRDIAFYGIKPDFRRVTQPYKNPNDKRIQRLLAAGKTGARLYDWWDVNQVKNVNKDKTKHPCQMPLQVMENVVGILPDGVCVIDPFMGSGTTGVACKNKGVQFIGIELVREYYELAKERIFDNDQGQ